MTGKPLVLFVTFDGLLETVVDSQVLDHAREIAEAGIAEFEVWSLPCDAATYALSLARLDQARARAGCPVRVFRGVRPAAPFSARRNAAILDQAMRESRRPFSLVHARGDYAVLVAAALGRGSELPILWDCRGDSAAEVDYRADLRGTSGRLKAPFLRRLLRSRMRWAAALCDRALFVSAPLRDLAAGDLGAKPRAVVPCCADEDQFFFDPALREQARADLGYASGDFVFVYTGTLHAYQRFDDTVSAFGRFREGDGKARLLVVTPEREKASQSLRRLPESSWKVVTAPFAEVNRLLNAADAAFLLRHATATNRAASPTKFAEYCLAGLPVVMTDAVPDSHRLAAAAGNVVPFDESAGTIGAIPAIDRLAVALHHRKVLGKKSFLPAYRAIYRAADR